MSPSDFCVRQKPKTFYIHVIDKNIRVIGARRMSSEGGNGQYGREKRGKKGFWWKTTRKDITWKT